MPTTGSGLFPYPNSSAVPDVPADLLLLAQRIELIASGWTLTANATTRAALVTNGNAYEGLHVYQIDTGILYIYLSSVWVEQPSRSTGSPTLSANISNKAGYTPKLEKNGNIVSLTFGVANSAATGTAVPGSGVSVMTLPAGFRPTSNTLVFGSGVNNSGLVALTFTVDASGVVKVNPASALGGGADLYGAISFSVA
jgi:hypothetical protein